MTDQPTDPNDETQPHDAFDWRPVGAVPTTPPRSPGRLRGGRRPGMASFSPAARVRGPSGRSRAGPIRSRRPERWFESAAPVRPVPGGRDHASRGAGAGTVIAAALAAAVLASGGTVVALNATGAFDRRRPPPPARSTRTPHDGQPAGHARRVVGDHRRRGRRPGRRSSGSTPTGDRPEQHRPASRPRASAPGIIFDAERLDPDEPPRRRRQRTSLTVELKDGTRYTGKIYGVDTLTDLAIVKIEATGLPAATIGDSDGLKVGELVVAIGSPLGTFSNTRDERDRVGDRPPDHDRRRRPREPHPDRRRDQPRQQRRTAPRRDGGRHRRQHRDRPRMRPGSASRSRSTSPGRSCARRSPASRSPRPYIGIHYVQIDAQIAKDHNLPVNDGRARPAATQTPTGEPAVVAGGPAARPASRTATSSRRSATRRSTRSIRSTRSWPSSSPGDTSR